MFRVYPMTHLIDTMCVDYTVEQSVSITMAGVQKWLSGNYKNLWNGKVVGMSHVEGCVATFTGLAKVGLNATDLDQRVWTSGMFGETHQQFYESTGATNYNFKTFSSSKPEEEAFGYVSDDGKVITATGGPPANMMFSMKWINDDEAKALIATISNNRKTS